MQAWNWDAQAQATQAAAAASYAAANAQQGYTVPNLSQAQMGYQQYYGTAVTPAATAELTQQQLEMQQQHWQQWQQWQQQYQQWHQEYGDKYQASLSSLAGAGSAPLPAVEVAQPPSLPPPEKPPPPPDPELQSGLGKREGGQGVGGDGSKKPRNNKEAAGGGAGELSEAEKVFDSQFQLWEKQFSEWKAQNINHPDKNQYREYEAKWRDWREKLLQRRVQMRRKREMSNAAKTAAEPSVEVGGVKQKYGNQGNAQETLTLGPGQPQATSNKPPPPAIKSLMDIPLQFMAAAAQKVNERETGPSIGQGQDSKVKFQVGGGGRSAASGNNVLNFPKTLQVSQDTCKAIVGPDKDKQDATFIGPQMPGATSQPEPDVVDITQEDKPAPNYDFLKKSASGIPGLDLFGDSKATAADKAPGTPNSNSQGSSMKFGQDSSLSQDSQHQIQTSQGRGFQFPPSGKPPQKPADLADKNDDAQFSQDVDMDQKKGFNMEKGRIAQQALQADAAGIQAAEEEEEDYQRFMEAGDGMAGFHREEDEAAEQSGKETLGSHIAPGMQGSNFASDAQGPNFGPTFGPGNQGSNIGPGHQGPNFGPGHQGPNFGPGHQGTNFGPGHQGTNFGPGHQVPNFGHGNQGFSFGPVTQGPNFGPGYQGPNFSPGYQISNFAQGNQGPNFGPGNQGPNFVSGIQGPNFGLGNQGPNFGLGNKGPNFGPGNQGTNFGPGNKGGNFGPVNQGPSAQGPNFGPGNQGSTFGPGNKGGNFGPGNQGSKFGPGNQGPNFGPGNQGPNFGPGNQGPNFGPGTNGPNVGSGNKSGNLAAGNQGSNFGPGVKGPNVGPGIKVPAFSPGSRDKPFGPEGNDPNLISGNQGPNFGTRNIGNAFGSPGNPDPAFVPGNKGPGSGQMPYENRNRPGFGVGQSFTPSGGREPDTSVMGDGQRWNQGSAPNKQMLGKSVIPGGTGIQPDVFAQGPIDSFPQGPRNNVPVGPRSSLPPGARENYPQGTGDKFSQGERDNFQGAGDNKLSSGPRDNFHQGARKDFPLGQRDNFPQGYRDNFLQGYRDNFPPGHRDNFPPGPRDKFLQVSRDNFPPGHRDNFPPGPRDNFPPGPRDNFPQGPRDNFPPGPRDNFPQGPRDNFPPGQRDNFAPGPIEGFSQSTKPNFAQDLRDTFPQGPQDNFPPGQKDNFPEDEIDDYPEEDPFAEDTQDPFAEDSMEKFPEVPRERFPPGPRDEFPGARDRFLSGPLGSFSEGPRERFPEGQRERFPEGPRERFPEGPRERFPEGPRDRFPPGPRDGFPPGPAESYPEIREYGGGEWDRYDRERDQGYYRRGVQQYGKGGGAFRPQAWDDSFELEPATIVEYGHKPAVVVTADSTPVAPTQFATPAQFLTPVQTFDYGHGSSTTAAHARDVSKQPFADSWHRDRGDRERQGYHPASRWDRDSSSRSANRREEEQREDDRFRRGRGDRDNERERDRGSRSRDRRDDSSGRSNGMKNTASLPVAPPPPSFSDQAPSPHKGDKAPPVPTQRPILIEDLLSPPGRDTRPARMVIVLRGPPGSGKSYVAKLIKDKEVEKGGSAPRILCLDDYFMVETTKEEKDPSSGRRVKVKSMEYEYEPEMEKHYRSSLIKAFRKTVNDNYFPFIIVDCVNQELKHFDEMWSYAKQKGFQVYVCEMDVDLPACVKRNTHGRTEKEIATIIKNWQPTPAHYLRLDVRSLLQSAAIAEVEMEDSIPDPPPAAPKEGEAEEGEEEEEGEGGEATVAVSKWEQMDLSGDTRDRLDGLMKRKVDHGSLEDWLTAADDYEDRRSVPGKKRVRWADLEEKRSQEKMRAIGFVVGQTDWSRMTDPTCGESALTQTKYI